MKRLNTYTPTIIANIVSGNGGGDHGNTIQSTTEIHKRRHIPKTLALNKHLAPDDPQQYFNEETLSNGLYASQKAFQDYRRYPNKIKKLQETIDKFNRSSGFNGNQEEVEQENFGINSLPSVNQGAICTTGIANKKNREIMSKSMGAFRSQQQSRGFLSSIDEKRLKAITECNGVLMQLKNNIEELTRKNGIENSSSIVDRQRDLIRGQKEVDKLKNHQDQEGRLWNRSQVDDRHKDSIEVIKLNGKQHDNHNNNNAHEDYEINPADNTFEILKKTKKAIDVMNDRCRQVKKELKSNFCKPKASTTDHELVFTALKTVNLASENVFDDEEYNLIIRAEEDEQMKIRAPNEKQNKGFKIRKSMAQSSGSHRGLIFQSIGGGSGGVVGNSGNGDTENGSKLHEIKLKYPGGDEIKKDSHGSKENSKKNSRMKREDMVGYRKSYDHMLAIQPNAISVEEKRIIKSRADDKHIERRRVIEEKLEDFHHRIDHIGIVSKEDNIFRIESMRYAQISRERARTNHEILREVKKKQMQPASRIGTGKGYENDKWKNIGSRPSAQIIQNNSALTGKSSNKVGEKSPHLLGPIGKEEYDSSLLRVKTSPFLLSNTKEDYHKRLVPKIKELITKTASDARGSGPYDLDTMHGKLGVLIRDKSYIPCLHLDSLRFSKFSGMV